MGYATCHWCHVLAEESFRDEAIAADIEARFVPVVVDREERPDLDEVWLEAVRRLTGKPGGWPLLVLLAPDGTPVSGATYLPPHDGDRGVARGLTTFLTEAADGWRDDPAGFAARGAEIAKALASPPRPAAGTASLAELERAALERLTGMEDREHGGFGSRPKFPRPVALDWLLGRSAATRDPAPAGVARRALDAIDEGALHDRLGGGFHRYAVDAAWRVPHFEKTLVDNTGLLRSYLLAWRLTGEPRDAEVVRSTARFLATLEVEGGLASALDADSLGPDGASSEGPFYTWTRAQVVEALGPEGETVSAALGLGETPTAPRNAGQVPDEALRRLAEVRAGRPAPVRDDKVVTAWQGSAIGALAEAGVALDDPEALTLALRLAEQALSRLGPDGRPRRTAGHDAPPAVLDDPAGLAAGWLALFEATADPRWLDAAVTVLDAADRWYSTDDGGLSRVASDQPTTLFRPTADEDGTEPSAAALLADAWITASLLTGDDRHRARAARAWAATAPRVQRSPVLHTGWLGVASRLERPPLELVLVWPDGAAPGPLRAALAAVASPGAVRLAVPASTALALGDRIPLLADRDAVEVPTVYVCRAGICRAPATTADAVRAAVAASL